MKELRESTYTRKETRLTSCDICAAHTDGDYWGDDAYTMDTVTIDMKEGQVYPEGDFREGHKYDICPNCFKEHIIPLMNSLDAEPTIYDLD